jgi:hypothetical protein
VSDDGGALNASKPTQGKIITLPRDGDGAVDDFNDKNIGFRRPDAPEFAAANRGSDILSPPPWQ